LGPRRKIYEKISDVGWIHRKRQTLNILTKLILILPILSLTFRNEETFFQVEDASSFKQIRKIILRINGVINIVLVLQILMSITLYDLGRHQWTTSLFTSGWHIIWIFLYDLCYVPTWSLLPVRSFLSLWKNPCLWLLKNRIIWIGKTPTILR